MQHIRRLLIPILAILLVIPATTHAEPGYDQDQSRAREEGTTNDQRINSDESTPVPPLKGAPAIKRQFRAAWVATVVNIDWPSNTGLPADQQKAELTRIFDDIKAMGMNAVVLQVRPTDDTFYRSTLNPWSKYLTGVAGQDPGYDPLAFAVAEAHKRNLELHAWFNPYRVSMDTKRESLPEGSFAKAHPDYVWAYGGKLYYDPGLPEAQQHIVDSIMEVVKHYDIDAVHFDDYFYPYPSGTLDYPDAATFAKYGAGFTNKADWRRSNINHLVQAVSQAIKAEKPYVQFGISPFGIWRNKSASVPEGSDTAGSESYIATSSDTRLWVKQGWLDYIAPQIYWSIGFKVADYQKLTTWWADVVRGTQTKLYIGHADYKVNANADPNWKKPGEIAKQLALNLTMPEVAGSIHFSYKDLMRNPLGVKDDVSLAYQHPALIPVMDQLPGQAPEAPDKLKAKRVDGGIQLTWQDADKQKGEPSGAAAIEPGTSAYYVLYRAPVGQAIDFNDARFIVATVRRTTDKYKQSFLDTTADATRQYEYVVTAVDRLHHESPAGDAATSQDED
jgi:uncharacterized lipoprotein YddW (UPF0748 family)